MNNSEWQVRPSLFAIIGAMSALAIYFLINDLRQSDSYFDLRVAIAAAITAFSAMFCFTAHRQTVLKCLSYAILVAAVVGGILYWRLYLQSPDGFSFFALGLTVLVLTPFFQSSLHSTFTDYKALHNFAWGNFLIGLLGFLFMGMCFALAHLLASLFSLVGIDLIKQLLREDLAPWLLCGTALGAAVGVLREHHQIVASTQSVVQSVFSLLVIPLALGLGGFIVVLPFTGLATLWDSTRNTSSTLFACAVFALIVVNAAVRDEPGTQTTNKIVLRFTRLLALTIAPLAAVGVVALHLRIEQYGWTPDRLWATVVCGLLLVYGITYLLAAMTKWFPPIIRKVNLLVALGVCALALLLATPLFDFGGVSTRNQLNRLSEGVISEDNLDVTALAFDFGPAGREALESLKSTASSDLVVRIDQSLGANSRWASENRQQNNPHNVRDNLVVIPSSWIAPEDFISLIINSDACHSDGYCYLFVSDNAANATVVGRRCTDACRPEFTSFRQRNSKWQVDHSGYGGFPPFDMVLPENSEVLEQADQALLQGIVDLRPVQRMQLFIGDQPFGPVIE